MLAQRGRMFEVSSNGFCDTSIILFSVNKTDTLHMFLPILINLCKYNIGKNIGALVSENLLKELMTFDIISCGPSVPNN